jgi:hypothetical protein
VSQAAAELPSFRGVSRKELRARQRRKCSPVVALRPLEAKMQSMAGIGALRRQPAFGFKAAWADFVSQLRLSI